MIATSKLIWLCLSICLIKTDMLMHVQAADGDWKGARDRFWRHHVRDKTLILNGVDYYEPMLSCLKGHFTEKEWRDIDTTISERRKVGFKLRDEYRNDKVILAIVEQAMAPLHVRAVQSLASCVRNIFPQFYEARAFYIELGMEEDDGRGGNNPTHLAPLVGVFFPAVYDEMQRTVQLAYDEANWSYYHKDNQEKYDFDDDEVIPTPDEIGFRASEHLTYKDFKEGLASHTDGRDTHFTVNFAFSGPEDYDGGFFFLRYGEGDLWGGGGNTPKEQILLKPNKYDCLIFLGGPYLHGVTEMTGGNREMFSSELWSYPDAPFGSTLWMNVASRMSQYVHKCNMEKVQGLSPANGSCQVNMTALQDDDTEDDDDDENIPNPTSWVDPSSGVLVDSRSCFDKDEENYFWVPSHVLSTGETRTLYWRADWEPLDSRYGMVIGLPAQLTQSIQQYLETSGWSNTVKSILYRSESDQSAKPHLHNRVLRLSDGSEWELTPLARKTKPETDLVRLEPVDYRFDGGNGSSLLDIFTNGNFGSLLPYLVNTLRTGDDVLDLGVKRIQILALTYSKDAGPSKLNEIHPDSNNEDNNNHLQLIIPVVIPSHERVALGLAQREKTSLSWGEIRLRHNMGMVLSGRGLYEPGDCNLRNDGEWQVWFVVTLGQQRHDTNNLASPNSTPTRKSNSEIHSSPFVWRDERATTCQTSYSNV